MRWKRWFGNKKIALKPLVVTWQYGIQRKDLVGVFDGIETMKRLLADMSVFDDLLVREKGAWRAFHWRNRANTLLANRSIDWVIQQASEAAVAHQKGDEYLSAEIILDWHQSELLQRPGSPYHLTVVKEKLYYARNGGLHDCLGVCRPGSGALVSLEYFAQENEDVRNICYATLTLHELLHLGDVTNRDHCVEYDEIAGKHCTNECVMQRSLPVADRLALWKKPYIVCPLCLKRAKEFFLSTAVL